MLVDTQFSLESDPRTTQTSNGAAGPEARTSLAMFWVHARYWSIDLGENFNALSSHLEEMFFGLAQYCIVSFDSGMYQRWPPFVLD